MGIVKKLKRMLGMGEKGPMKKAQEKGAKAAEKAKKTTKKEE